MQLLILRIFDSSQEILLYITRGILDYLYCIIKYFKIKIERLADIIITKKWLIIVLLFSFNTIYPIKLKGESYMNLGLKKDEVKIVPFDPEWSREFERVKKMIQQVLDVPGNQIEHIGSTAIVGIKAKPIIDILLGVEDLDCIDRNFERALRSIGFYRVQVERPNEVVFAKFADEGFETKTHFIHAVEFNGELWQNLIFFRNYLNENEAEKNAYEKVKEAYLENSSTGINDYTNFKEEFVQRVFLKREEG